MILLFGAAAAALAAAALTVAFLESPPDHLLGFLRTLGSGPHAHGLFLAVGARVEPRVGDAGGDATLYLRDVDRRGAVLVTQAPLARGDRLSLAVGDLPGYPARGTRVHGARLGHEQDAGRVAVEAMHQPGA